MNETLIDHEFALRLGAFLGVLGAMALWEIAAPRRVLGQRRTGRWGSNLALALLNGLAVRVVFPASAVGVALLADARGWGFLPLLGLPAWLEILLAFVALDLVIYLQHVMVHAVPAFWRLHRVHHSDPDFDTTTGVRFHPVEILLSMLIKCAAIAALGAPAAGVVLFEVVLNASSLFNHGNVRLPLALDRGLRAVIVTPDMHRVHHSVREHETNSNFGFNLSVWDRLMGTYRAQPADGHEAMRIGLEGIREPRHLSLAGLLMQPFSLPLRGYAIGERRHGGEE